jgi:hypothetical protein
MVSEVSAYPGRKGVVLQNCLPHGSQEAERAESDQGKK